MDTLIDGISKLKQNGFRADFQITEEGLRKLGDDRIYEPNEVTLLCHKRFEGKSNPSDMSILYGLETDDNDKGLLINAYGPYGNDQVDNFMKKVRRPKSEKYDC